MSRRLLRTWQQEDGGAVIEVAVVMPVLMLMLAGAMQFGVVLFGYCAASYAARSAARYASVHSSTSLVPATTASVQAVVTPWLWMGKQVSTPTVTVSWPNGNTIGSTVSVTVQMTYSAVLPFSGKSQLVIGTVSSRYIVR